MTIEAGILEKVRVDNVVTEQKSQGELLRCVARDCPGRQNVEERSDGRRKLDLGVGSNAERIIIRVLIAHVFEQDGRGEVSSMIWIIRTAR